MSKYYDCMTTAKYALDTDTTKEQVIQAANGIYLADRVAGAIKAACEKVMAGDGHHHGLTTLIDTLNTKAKVDTK